MAARKDTLFETYLAPVASLLIDREELLQIHRSIDWPQAIVPFTDPDLVYPEYYATAPFHGIGKGYLTPDAATTYDPVTRYALPPHEGWVRHGLIEAISYPPRRILDLGCGTGSSTLLLKQTFPEAQVIGLDLSPYMLLMAERKAKDQQIRIEFIHGMAEDTGFESDSFDLVTASLLFHELPPRISRAVLQEGYRLLKPEASVLILDGNQRTLRSTQWLSEIFEEPYIQDYAQGSLDAWLGAAGYENVRTSDHWVIHQISVGTKP